MSFGIATTTFHQYKHTGMLYFGYKLKIAEKYKYVVFSKSKTIKIGDNHMKAAKFKGLSWLK